MVRKAWYVKEGDLSGSRKEIRVANGPKSLPDRSQSAHRSWDAG